MTVQTAQPGRALHAPRHQRGTRLPIDVLITHHPNRRDRVLPDITLGSLSRCGPGQRPQDVLSRCVAADRAQHEQERARRPANPPESLPAHPTVEEVLGCAARILHSRHHHCIPAML